VRWLCSNRAEEGDLELVIEVLHSIMHGAWRNRWYIIEDESDPGPLMPVCTILPSDSLMVLVRKWPAEDPPELEILGIHPTAELPELNSPEDR